MTNAVLAETERPAQVYGLTPEEVQVLNIYANYDCFLEQIARYLNKSKLATDQIMVGIRIKLRVRTEFGAIKKGIQCGYISYM